MAGISIARVRDLVRSRRYVVTLHAAEELEDDHLSILDLESIVLTARVVERQRDPRTRESKLVLRGRSLDGREGEAVVKIGPTGALVVITNYLL